MIKDVVVCLPVGSQRDIVIDYATSVAGLFDAHVSAVGFVYEPVVPGAVFDGVAADLIDAQRAESEKVTQAVVAKFDEALRRTGVSGDSRILHASHVDAPDLFGRLARRFDLSVVAQAEPGMGPTDQWFIEAALFDSGRSVLIVPYIQKAGIKLERMMVCWDGSRSAARVIGDAMPFLSRAAAIDIVVIASERAKEDDLPGADMAQHLARHGLKVNIRNIVAADIDVPSTILSYAADSSADLIVMGGYGHSRLRELVLGGATRGILSSMTVPTLMSH